jgi:hypothetical protein
MSQNRDMGHPGFFDSPTKIIYESDVHAHSWTIGSVAVKHDEWR